jgi:excisionase family DNA binding protein
LFELLWKGVKEMEKLAYNMKEVAEVLGISKSLAYEMAKKGELPIIRMGNRILVPIKRLEEMFDVTE